MLTKPLSACSEILAGDKTLLRELLHPSRDPAAIGYSLAHAKLAGGTASLPHRLKTSEVYYFISGRGLMHVGGDTAAVGPEQALYVPPGTVQHLENTGPDELVFLCIVDPAWRAEDETVKGKDF
ncbi:MAG: cupin domain-containing protein [Nitrospirae bacterium]|nr:cupin domain-containing protein [Nitrospirota bacterium]